MHSRHILGEAAKGRESVIDEVHTAPQVGLPYLKDHFMLGWRLNDPFGSLPVCSKGQLVMLCLNEVLLVRITQESTDSHTTHNDKQLIASLKVGRGRQIRYQPTTNPEPTL